MLSRKMEICAKYNYQIMTIMQLWKHCSSVQCMFDVVLEENS